MTAIIILGAAVGPDGPSPSLQRRTTHAAALYRAGAGDLIVPCGGLGRFPPTEAEAMWVILRDAGIPESAILCDHSSANTVENLLNARALMAKRQKADAIVVTDGIHAPRALLTAWALHLRAQANTPPIGMMPIKTRLRRFRHEALSFPIYLVRAPWWRWRYRTDQT